MDKDRNLGEIRREAEVNTLKSQEYNKKYMKTHLV